MDFESTASTNSANSRRDCSRQRGNRTLTHFHVLRPERSAATSYATCRFVEHLVRFELAIAVWKTALLPLHHRCLMRVTRVERATPRLKVQCSASRASPASEYNWQGSCHLYNRLSFFMLFISYRRYGTRTHTHVSCFGF